MNAHPKTAALAAQLDAAEPAANPHPTFAERLVQAAKTLLPMFETGKPINAKTLRAAMLRAFGDTSGAVGRSLVIRLHAQEGRKAGGWTDYATGEFGDLIDLLHAKLGSRSLRETLHEAQQFLGTAPLPVPQVSTKVSRDEGAANTKRIASARRLFASGRPMLGTAAATYLLRRGIARFGPALRYHPRVYFRGANTGPDQPSYAPALLAKITDNKGNITGCARTYLDPITGGIADLNNSKRILGQL